MRHFGRRVFVAGLCSATLAACAETQPTRFYALSPIADPDRKAPRPRPSELAFAVGPVRVADFLDRPQIVRRETARRLVLSDFDHWAEPLDAMIARTLSENLAALLGARDVAILPSQRALDLDWAVAVDVLRFDAEPDGEAVAEFRWRLTGRSPDEVLHASKTSIRAPSPPGDFDALTAGLEAALERLAREVAEVAPEAAETS